MNAMLALVLLVCAFDSRAAFVDTTAAGASNAKSIPSDDDPPPVLAAKAEAKTTDVIRAFSSLFKAACVEGTSPKEVAAVFKGARDVTNSFAALLQLLATSDKKLTADEDTIRKAVVDADAKRQLLDELGANRRLVDASRTFVAEHQVLLERLLAREKGIIELSQLVEKLTDKRSGGRALTSSMERLHAQWTSELATFHPRLDTLSRPGDSNGSRIPTINSQNGKLKKEPK